MAPDGHKGSPSLCAKGTLTEDFLGFIPAYKTTEFLMLSPLIFFHELYSFQLHVQSPHKIRDVYVGSRAKHSTFQLLLAANLFS